MATNTQAEAEKAEWIAQAPGIAMDPDQSYGLQCKDVPDQYGIDLYRTGLFVALKGGDAMTVLDGANRAYYEVIRNDPNRPELIPAKGDVIVWGGNTANPYGHVAIVEKADANGVDVVQQDGFAAPLKAFHFNDGTVRYYSQKPTHRARLGYWNPGTGMVAGWLRPRPEKVVYSGADKRGYGSAPAPQKLPGAYALEVRETFPAHTARAAVAAVFGYTRPAVPVSDVLHHWDDPAKNPQFDAVCRHFETQPPGGVSAHYVLEAGRVRRGVSERDASHANGHAAANAMTVTWECNPRCSAEDRETLAHALADAWIARGRTTPGLIELHKDYFGTACPGRYEDHLPAIRARAAELFAAKRAGGTVTTQSTNTTFDLLEWITMASQAEINRALTAWAQSPSGSTAIGQAVLDRKFPDINGTRKSLADIVRYDQRNWDMVRSIAKAVNPKTIALAVWGYRNPKVLVTGDMDTFGQLATVLARTTPTTTKES